MIHITKRHSFTVLHSLHSLYQSVYAYMNIRITMVMLLRHTGHVSITATRFAELSQKRACPQGTSVNPSRGATKHFTGGVCGCTCRSVWRRGRRSWYGCRRLAVIRAFQFGQKKSFDSIFATESIFSIRQSDKFAACTLIFK